MRPVDQSESGQLPAGQFRAWLAQAEPGLNTRCGEVARAFPEPVA